MRTTRVTRTSRAGAVRAAGMACALALVVAGCGASSSDPASGRPASGEQADTSMKGMDMGTSASPSAPAAMICSEEIREAVGRLFGRGPVRGQDSWSAADRVFTCTYRLPAGELRLTVQDALRTREGKAYYDGLLARTSGARPITGMENFGFPAFLADSGHVVFLKDGKTLDVDTSGLDRAELPRGYSRSQTAYSVASSVIACWTE